MENLRMRSLGSFTSDEASRMYLGSLEDAGVTIPATLRSSVLSNGSLFHAHSKDYLGRSVSLLEIAQDLLAAGFVHINEPWDGVTPLMAFGYTYTARVADILLDNGADPDKEIPLNRIQNLETYHDERRHRAAHKLAFEIARYGLTPGGILCLAPLRGATLQITTHDPCSCGCSPEGCTPLTSVLKGLKEGFTSPHTGRSPKGLISYSGMLHQHKLSCQSGSTVAFVYIRMLTFDSLELTHTCCSFRPAGFSVWRWGPMVEVKEQEEANRIQEEERAGLQLLERLMEEFTGKFAELDIDLESFLRGYWRERMEAELYGQDEIPTDEIELQRELGVWLRREKDTENSFFAKLCPGR
jgi:hypothetical protein